MFMGFTKHFYIILGLTINQKPSPNCCFLAYFSVSKKRNIKRSPNGMKPLGELFLERKQSRRLRSRRQGSFEVATREGGTPAPLGAPPPSWAPSGSPDRLLSPIYIHIP